jgi:signal transduction histidine kinase
VVIAFFLGGMATEVSGIDSDPLNDAAGLLALLALWPRRRFPLTVAAIAFVTAVVAPFAAGAAIVCVYTIAAHHHRRPRTAPVVVLLALLYTCAGIARLDVANSEQDDALVLLVASGAVLTAAAYGWGLAVRSRRQVLTMLAERAERAEAEQHARVHEARRAERARIAAEMHDVLAHRLSMLSLHAGAIELRPQAPPEDRARAAGVVRSSAHQALVELREVIGVLRDDGLGGLAPQPSAADLDALIVECRAAGMRIELTGTLPDPDGVPLELGRHLYRIVQEGLTNARKHAPGAPVRLELTGAAGEGLTVVISNPLISGGAAQPPGVRVPGAGAGLIGLRERVELAGGTLERQAAAAGRHRLKVWLPWPA